MKGPYSKGFTLIEMILVVSIISFLASVVLSSLNDARERARDVTRLSELKSIENALAIYHSENGVYPAVINGIYTHSSSTRQDAWSDDLINLLISADALGDFIPSESISADSRIWRYDSDVGDNYQSYGLAVQLESSNYSSLESGDGGGMGNYYEVGDQPKYCNQTHSEDWAGNETTVCETTN